MPPIDFQEMLWFADRAEAAYRDQSFIVDRFPQLTDFKKLNSIDVQYFVETFVERHLQVISIRGTANFKNFAEDDEYLKVKNGRLGIYTHFGFNRDATEVYSQLLPALNKECAICVTGHSLGAAIATLVMLHLLVDGYQIKMSYNFGQPKFTNRAGADKYSSLPMVRVVDDNDVIPQVPADTLTASIHGFYDHIGPEIVLLKEQYYSNLQTHDAERIAVGSFWKNILHESLGDHKMANYLKHILTKVDSAIEIPYTDREHYK